MTDLEFFRLLILLLCILVFALIYIFFVYLPRKKEKARLKELKIEHDAKIALRKMEIEYELQMRGAQSINRTITESAENIKSVNFLEEDFKINTHANNSNTKNSDDIKQYTTKYCDNCGTKLLDGAVFCSHCGHVIHQRPVQLNQTSVKNGSDKNSAGLNILSFLFPIIGLILYLVFKEDKPIKAKGVGKWTLISFIINIVLTVIMFASV